MPITLHKCRPSSDFCKKHDQQRTYFSETTISDTNVPHYLKLRIKDNYVADVTIKFIVTNLKTLKANIKEVKFMINSLNKELHGNFSIIDELNYSNCSEINLNGISYTLQKS